MQQLLAAAASMQSQLLSAQQELADAEVLGTAGGGLVTVTVNGQGELVDVTISADAIDPADPEESAQSIADLVLAAYRAACGAVDELQQRTMAPFAAGFGGGGQPGMPDLSALGLPGLGGPAEAGTVQAGTAGAGTEGPGAEAEDEADEPPAEAGPGPAAGDPPAGRE
jgi:nucleoid-associated protein EbfC